jgi:hypothetical protein
MLDIKEYLKSLNRRSKKEDIPGATQEIEGICPCCGKGLKKVVGCCSAKNGSIQCRANCGYKVSL